MSLTVDGPGDEHSTVPSVLHVVSYDVARGAERYARALVEELNGREGARHVLVAIFRGEGAGLWPDHSLDVPQGPFRSLGFDPRAVIRLRRLLTRLRPCVAIAHGGETAKYLSLAVTRDVPFVYLMIGSAHPRLSSPIRRLMRRFYVGRASGIAAVSERVAMDAASAGLAAPDSIDVIPNGRDPRVFYPRSSENDVFRIAFVGRLEDQKRPWLFIEVVSELRRRGLAVNGLIAGDGPLMESLRGQAEQSGVELLGSVDDVPALLASCDALALVSRPPEGMPGVLIEAGLAGLPVVSTNVPGADEVVVDGDTGFLVSVDDREGLIGRLHTLATDKGLGVAMGERGRRRCEELFSLSASADRWEVVISRFGC